MKWPWDKQPQAAAPQPKAPGIFALPWQPPTAFEKAAVQRAALARTFQRGTESLRTQNGVAMDTMDFAQDSAFVSLTAPSLNGAPNAYLPDVQLEWYSQQGFLGWQTCALLAQHWLIDKACDMPAKDAVRHGWELSISGGDKLDDATIDKIRKLDKRYRIKAQCRDYIRKANIFGVRVALFIVDGVNQELPMNLDGVRPGAYKGIKGIDPYWITPILDTTAVANPAAMDFYVPTWWQVGNRRIHKSWLGVMRPFGDVPDVLKPTYYYGGLSVPQKMFERVYAAERTANETPMLAMSKRLTAMKIDTSQGVATPADLTAKMTAWAQMMNNFGVKTYGPDEEIVQFDTSLASLDETVMTQYQLVAGAAGVPVTKLIGTTPKGFNATGEYDESSYHENLESLQENDLTPFLDKHYALLLRSHPELGITGNIEIAWKPCDAMTAEELANVNKAKAETDTMLINAGILSPDEARQRLKNDPDSGHAAIADEAPLMPDLLADNTESDNEQADIDESESTLGGTAQA